MGGWIPFMFICQCVRLEWYRDSDFIVLRGRFASQSVSQWWARQAKLCGHQFRIKQSRPSNVVTVGDDDDEADAILFYVILKAVSSKINCLPRNNGIIADRKWRKYYKPYAIGNYIIAFAIDCLCVYLGGSNRGDKEGTYKDNLEENIFLVLFCQ